MRFYPPDANAPEILETAELVLRPLSPDHVELDHAALMTSKEMLRLWSGSPNGGWPQDDFTVAENMRDMRRHYREHLAREAFTFTVLNRSKDAVLGCVYIVPFEPVMAANPHLANLVSDDCAMVGFWVIEPRLAEGLDARLLKELVNWFNSQWQFDQVFFNVFKGHQQQIETLERNGLRRVAELTRPNRGEFLLYQ